MLPEDVRSSPQGTATFDCSPSTFREGCISGERLTEFHRNVQRFRGGLVYQAHRLCVSLNARLERNEEEKNKTELMLAAGTAEAAVERYLAHKKQRPPRKDPTVGLCLGPYGGASGGRCFL